MAEEDKQDDLERAQDIEGAEGVDGESDGDDGGKKKLIIIIAGVVVLLLGAGAGLYFTGVIGGGKDKATADKNYHGDDHADEEEHSDGHDGHSGDHSGDHGDEHGGDYGDDGHGDAKDGKSVKSGKVSFLAMPAMNVTLNSDDGAPRYLRLAVQLELHKSEDKKAVEAVMPRVVDKFQTYLRELRVRDLRGSGGIYRLQMELLWRVNQAAAPVEVKDVLFQEILIQ